MFILFRQCLVLSVCTATTEHSSASPADSALISSHLPLGGVVFGGAVIPSFVWCGLVFFA